MKRLIVALLLTLPVAAPGCTQPTEQSGVDSRIAQVVDTVSEARLQQIVERLAAFGTRNTLSDVRSTTRGIGAAGQWIFDELQRSSAKLQVSFDTYRLVKDGRITRDVELRNIVAVLPGRSARRVYVSAHYDTVNIPGGQLASASRPAGQAVADPQLRADQDYDIDAPGANDNGSGTATVLELATVLAHTDAMGSNCVVLFGAEEIGLVGSKAFVNAMTQDDRARLRAMLNFDMVGVGDESWDLIGDAGDITRERP